MKHDPLGDGISSVELKDVMGDDLMVVNAARVSMHKESEYDESEDADWHGICGNDQRLINYLAKHKHWTPFSHPQVQLRIKMPIFIARQWFKHMVGFTRNEVSRRYVDDTPEFYVPTEWRKRAENVKQGSSEDAASLSITLQNNLLGILGWNKEIYEDLLEEGVAPEMARMVLPQSMYTEFIETGSLAAYARLCGLRLDPHAQKEVRMYAEAVSKIIGELFPVSWSALNGG